MKQKIYKISCMLFILGITITVQAQVGINTEDPKATLEIKSTGNTEATKVFSAKNKDEENLMLVTDDGKVGIGVSVPKEKLEIKGNAKISQMIDASTKENEFINAVVAKVDGTLGIVQRASPNAPSPISTVYGIKEKTSVWNKNTFYQIQQTWSNKGQIFHYAGQSISLPPGKWVVYCGYLITSVRPEMMQGNKAVWIRGTLSDNKKDSVIGITESVNYYDVSSVETSGPVLISTNFIPNMLFSVASGLWLVHNTTNANKTYYLKVSAQVQGFSQEDKIKPDDMGKWAEDYIFAIKRD